MTLTVEWPQTGAVRTFRDLSQAEVNRHINYLSELRQGTPEVQILITVEKCNETTRSS